MQAARFPADKYPNNTSLGWYHWICLSRGKQIWKCLLPVTALPKTSRQRNGKTFIIIHVGPSHMTFLPPVLRIIKTFKDIPFHLILFTLSCTNAIFRGLSLVNIKLRGYHKQHKHFKCPPWKWIFQFPYRHDWQLR